MKNYPLGEAQLRVLALLADGEEHTVADIREQTGATVQRTAKINRSLSKRGLITHSVRWHDDRSGAPPKRWGVVRATPLGLSVAQRATHH